MRAWLIASDTIGLRAEVEQIRARSRDLMVEAELEAFFALERAASRATRVTLAILDTATISLADAVGRFRPAFAAIAARFEGYLAGREQERFERYYRTLRASGLAEADAHQIARLEFADHLIEVIQIGFDLGVPVEQAAAVFFGLAAGIDFAAMDDAIRSVGTEDPWERRAAQELDQGLRAARIRLARAILENYQGDNRDEILRRLGQTSSAPVRAGAGGAGPNPHSPVGDAGAVFGGGPRRNTPVFAAGEPRPASRPGRGQRHRALAGRFVTHCQRWRQAMEFRIGTVWPRCA